MSATVENITVSIPSKLIAVVEEIVEEDNTNRSKVISRCIEDMAKKRVRKLMEEGYKAMAKEQKQIAREFLELQSEVVPDW